MITLVQGLQVLCVLWPVFGLASAGWVFYLRPPWHSRWETGDAVILGFCLLLGPLAFFRVTVPGIAHYLRDFRKTFLKTWRPK